MSVDHELLVREEATMRRRWFLFLVCLGCALLFALFSASQVTTARFEVRVDESATRFFLKELAPEVSFVVNNGSSEPFRARIKLELLTPNNNVAATTERKVELQKGNQTLRFTLPFKTRDLSPDEEDEILWYRLHYTISPEASDESVSTDGFISLSLITPDLFELRVIGARRVAPGSDYVARVRAAHPITLKPFKNVHVRGVIEAEDNSDNDIQITASALTNDQGDANLVFKLPVDIDDDEIEVKVEGTLGLLTVKSDRDIDVESRPLFLVSTDKPLYQPGQTVYSRLLLLSPSKKVLADRDIDLKITDPESTTVFTASGKTSRFGIATFEWSIPSSSRLGDYSIEYSVDDNHDSSSRTRIKISRYDLPNFAVSVKTDRQYYLQGQNASVVVKADYLFGQPVTRGRVKVVRESEREWNYREQKYDINEGDKYEGETLADGTFKANIDLTKDHDGIAGTDYSRFEDLNYVAYFTDPTTNRTEQRRFNLRVTKEAIHIYVVRPRDSYSENLKLPLGFYITTSYADGTPAPANVEIKLAREENPPTLAKIKTNRLGIAAIRQLKLTNGDAEESEVSLSFTARDQSGLTGKHTETINTSDEPTLRVETNKALYATGQPIAVTVSSSEPNLPLMLSVSRNGVSIYSTALKLRGTRGMTVIPYRPEFKDELTVSAFAESLDDDADFLWGAHTVLYPRPRNLNVSLQPTAKTYRPGEKAHVKLNTVGPSGSAVETALGIVVTDKAVDERVRTDQEYSWRYASFYDDVLSQLGFYEGIASVTRQSLDSLKMDQPVPAEIELAAEVLLNQGHDFNEVAFGGEGYDKDLSSVFSGPIEQQLKPIRTALNETYERTRVYPTSDQSLTSLLAQAKLDLRDFPDPWGQQYRKRYFVDHQLQHFVFHSAGADKRFDSDDDFEVFRMSFPYFRPIGEAIDAVVREYHSANGGYIRTLETLSTELRRKNVDLNSLRDPWGKLYTFEFLVSGTNFLVVAKTIDPTDGTIKPEPFTLWQTSIDYFAENRWNIDTILYKQFREKSLFPSNEKEFHAEVTSGGVDTRSFRDPWNHPYYLIFEKSSFYSDRVKIEKRLMANGSSSQHVALTPVTNQATMIRIKSAGADGREGTVDDFEVANFSATLMEQSAKDATPQPVRTMVTFSGSTGAIGGTITDPVDAVVMGVKVTAKSQNSQQVFETTSNDDGKYLLRNIPPGIYEVRAEAPGFKATVISHVIVRSSQLITLDFSMEVGGVAEAVTVTSGGLATLNASNLLTIDGVNRNALQLVKIAPGVVASKQQLSTPRLREYFPETLLWQPQLTTDKKGRAQLDFTLADNITTWRMSVIGSTEDGELGTAETEIRAFQPFFAELDPPKVLTEGDRISLPVVLRNYLDRKQTVNVSIKPESWFKLLEPGQKQAVVPAGDSANQYFNFQAIASTKTGKQRVTAIASDFSDAIEKPVTVHPDGEEKSQSSSDLLNDKVDLNVELPTSTIANSAETELKVYPNLMTHVWESVEGIMQRPYGCGEQTISSTYPSLMVVRYLKNEEIESALGSKARRYLEQGYQRLLSYQAGEGGFAYWTKGSADLALTAYAIRFLDDASTVTSVDAYVIESARKWLVTQQQANGSWQALNWDKKVDARRTAMLTALVARTLASTKSSPQIKTSLTNALDYLENQTSGIDEPYLIASYSLAATVSGDAARAEKANARLKSLAHAEGPGSYWSLEANTPFYGWGLAGRVETTALVVQALARQASGSDQESRNLQTRGLLFLLKNQDRYGVWYSTQATINVLDAMLSLMSANSRPNSSSSPVEVLVNGQSVQTLNLPTDSKMTAPLTVNLSSFIRNGNNKVEVRRANGGSPVSVQVVTNFYIPWKDAKSSAGVRSGDAESLKLETNCDKTESSVNGEITCRVKAERIGFRGYGMLLAEIGLPPGADVDRASLDSAVKSSDWSITDYDVLPDRVVVYLWPRAGGSQFSFKFKPRFPMTAKAAASTIYDYYNPEARASVAPGIFTVK